MHATQPNLTNKEILSVMQLELYYEQCKENVKAL